MQAAWDKISTHLTREDRQPETCDLYGPWAPSERDLKLLGELRGRRLLELGCGAGRCAVALAEAGAQVTALDISPVQLATARQRAEAANVFVTWIVGSADNLGAFSAASFELILASYSLPYMSNLAAIFHECARVLVPGGRFVFAFDHPVRTVFFDEADEELVAYPARSYFDPQPLRWRYPGTGVVLTTQQRTVEEWLELGHQAGLRLVTLREPAPPADLLDDLWPEDDPRAPLRNLPQAIIFVMEKPGLR